MIELEDEAFKRLAFEVRQFLQKADIMTQLSVAPVLYLEFPDVGRMHGMHRAILRAMQPVDRMGVPFSYPDDHTIKYEPYAGVTIVLSCKQRFAVQSGGSVGYRDIAFKKV